MTSFPLRRNGDLKSQKTFDVPDQLTWSAKPALGRLHSGVAFRSFDFIRSSYPMQAWFSPLHIIRKYRPAGIVFKLAAMSARLPGIVIELKSSSVMKR